MKLKKTHKPSINLNLCVNNVLFNNYIHAGL